MDGYISDSVQICDQMHSSDILIDHFCKLLIAVLLFAINNALKSPVGFTHYFSQVLESDSFQICLLVIIPKLREDSETIGQG